MKIRFCGATGFVTGSCYLLDTGKTKVLVDCGMYQGSKEITRKNYQEFLFNPGEVDALFLTHAHIDHSGLIPKLVKAGFKGEIYGTEATLDLAEVMLADSAHIQELDTEHENKRRERKGEKPRKPLYEQKDVEEAIKLFKKIKYNTEVNFNEFRFFFRDAGHILGSAHIELFVNEGSGEKKIIFSGDIGQWDVPIINDPTLFEHADYVFIESTYGDRLHREKQPRDEILHDIIKETYEKGGKLLIPSFAIERTQEIIYAINKMIENGDFPPLKIYLDSPLAIKATEIFKKHKELYDEEARNDFPNPFNLKQLEYTSKTEESIALNNREESCIIIAGSGMCTAGRIRHHLKHGLWNPKNTVVFVGYQAEGTLGRIILEGAKKVKMMGTEVAVKADIKRIHSFSAHADYLELIKWAEGFKTRPEKFFIVHGEQKSSESLADKLNEKGFNTHIPKLGEEIEI